MGLNLSHTDGGPVHLVAEVALRLHPVRLLTLHVGWLLLLLLLLLLLGSSLLEVLVRAVRVLLVGVDVDLNTLLAIRLLVLID
jgi:hypothetical protein